MLRATTLIIGLCAVVALMLYVYYSGDTVPGPRPGERPANYRELAQFSPVDVLFTSPQVGWLEVGINLIRPDQGRILATRDGEGPGTFSRRYRYFRSNFVTTETAGRMSSGN